MERDSFAYKVRRKMQVLAQRLLPDAFLSRIYFRLVLKKKLNLKHPETFNEKLQWLKLNVFPKDDTVVRCADKVAVRSYVEEKGYGDLLVPLLGVWEDPEEIEFNSLPERFVLKCNHGCAYNLLCHDRAQFDEAAARRQLKSWLKEDFGAFNVELHYSRIQPHLVLCEEYLGSCITDYKFFCFHGEPKFIYVSSDLVHDRQAEIGFFYLDGSKMPLRREDYTDIASVEFPPFFEEMRATAERLSQDFPFVRVDFFLANGRYYFAELTFTPSACMMPFNPDHYDREWGDLLRLEDI